jgi:hypothetical protein
LLTLKQQEMERNMAVKKVLELIETVVLLLKLAVYQQDCDIWQVIE